MTDYVLIDGFLFRTENAMYLEKEDPTIGEHGSGLSLQLFSGKDEDWYVEKDAAESLSVVVPVHRYKDCAPVIRAQLIVRIIE